MTEPRPLWMTAVMMAAGVTLAPLAILAIALGLGATGASETSEVAIAYFGFLAVSLVTVGVRAIRPLGIGMTIGTVVLALMFLVQGGTNA